MGLSSSQARLLNLTARMHQIEYKAAKLEAQKLQMANESRRVYDEYLVALDKTKVQVKTINNDGSFGYIDATYNNLIAAGYKIEFNESVDSQTAEVVNKVTPKTTVPTGYTGIYTAEDFITQVSANPSGKYILMSNLDFSGIDYTPIANFSGTLDGNGHAIKNLSINKPDEHNVGLFATSGSGAIIKNLIVTNASVTGREEVGILVGKVCGNIQINNCSVQGTADGNCTIGGFCGGTASSSEITIESSCANVQIDSGSDLGGFVGAGKGVTIRNSFTKGSISGLIHVGGLCGSANVADIRNCYSTCDVSGEDKYASIVGRNYNAPGISDTYATHNYGVGGSTSEGTLVTETELESLIASGTLKGSQTVQLFDHENDTEWLTNMIIAGAITISKPDSSGNFFETSVAIDTGLQEVSDETLLRKAEAKYEADMRKIDAKDRKYDTDLAALDAERNAIKSEMETLKTVAKDNVERTFKLFS